MRHSLVDKESDVKTINNQVKEQQESIDNAVKYLNSISQNIWNIWQEGGVHKNGGVYFNGVKYKGTKDSYVNLIKRDTLSLVTMQKPSLDELLAGVKTDSATNDQPWDYVIVSGHSHHDGGMEGATFSLKDGDISSSKLDKKIAGKRSALGTCFINGEIYDRLGATTSVWSTLGPQATADSKNSMCGFFYNPIKFYHQSDDGQGNNTLIKFFEDDWLSENNSVPIRPAAGTQPTTQPSK